MALEHAGRPVRLADRSSTGADVAIVGASAAGLFAAELLARGGGRVRVLERSSSIDRVARTLIVTGKIRDILGPLDPGTVVNVIRRFELFADGRVATIPLRDPDLIVERSALIRELAARAVSAGAEILHGRRFAGLEHGRSGFTIDTGVDEVRARTVVGADGAFSRVARAAGWPAQPTVPLVQALVRLPDDIAPDTSRVWFRPGDTPYFYWLIPESAERAAVGLIGVDGPATRDALDRFLADNGMKTIDYQAARIPRYARWIRVRRRVGDGDVWLVGDAAGQVKVSTVGGLVTGFRGAAGVASAILGHGGGDLRKLRRELDGHLALRRAMHRFGESEYRRMLELIHGSARDLLATRTRDESVRLLGGLVLRQPRLAALGLRGLLLNRG